MVKVRFIEAALRSAKPRRIKYDIHDPDGTGLLLRVSPQGRKTWMVSYRSPTGIKQQRPIGKYPAMGIAEARRAALLALNGGQDAAGER
ncbi:MAG: Arm DNA-binding domain-containing protein [Nitrospiraceae bacterium]